MVEEPIGIHVKTIELILICLEICFMFSSGDFDIFQLCYYRALFFFLCRVHHHLFSTERQIICKKSADVLHLQFVPKMEMGVKLHEPLEKAGKVHFILFTQDKGFVC